MVQRGSLGSTSSPITCCRRATRKSRLCKALNVALNVPASSDQREVAAPVQRDAVLRHPVEDLESHLHAGDLAACPLRQQVGRRPKHVPRHGVQECECCGCVLGLHHSMHERSVLKGVCHSSMPAATEHMGHETL
jgi:hypothetical protein